LTVRAPGRPTDTETGEVRDRLLSEGARLFADHGYSGASIQEIVDAAGTTKPMVYYYFQSKEGLYEAIFHSCRDNMKKKQESILDDAELSTREKLARLIDTHFELARSTPDLARFMFLVYYGPQAELPQVDKTSDKSVVFQGVLRVVTEGIERDELAGDPIQLTLAILGQVLIQLTAYLQEPDLLTIDDESARNAVDVLMSGISR